VIAPVQQAFIAALPATLRHIRPVEVLGKALASGRVPHALLLHGDSLEAVEAVALALADTLLQSGGNPLAHPDLFTLRPVGKARMIRVGDRNGDEPNTMRTLLRDLQQSSRQGGAKVAIVYEANRMNDATANAFLKTLEEPPRQTTLLLLTTRPYDLLDTIRSRCFQFRLPLGIERSFTEDWQRWLGDYQQWVASLFGDLGSANVRTAAAMHVYGLICRFDSALASAADAAVQDARQRLPKDIGDDEVEALEAGIRKGIRHRYFQDIAEATRHCAIAASQAGPYPALAVTRTLGVLERAAGLTEVNLKEEAALEYFLLQSLRIWADPER
jgi:DNA polymerase III subunit delta'